MISLNNWQIKCPFATHQGDLSAILQATLKDDKSAELRVIIL
jgi:hypothetical protein